MEPETKLYTTPEAAQQLGVSASHMRNMIRTGIAKPKVMVGGTWMLTPEEIERLRSRRTNKSSRPERRKK